MKYNLMIRSRPTEDIFRRHDRFMTLLSGLGNEWGLNEGAMPPKVKDPGTDPMREVSLSRCFPKGIKALVSYQNRKYFQDEAMYDDYFDLHFDPSKFDYSTLCERIFPEYIEAFDAYYGEIGDEELTFLGFDRSRKVEGRNAVHRIYPVCFFDRELCERAFHSTPEAIARQVAAHVEKTLITSKGVCIVATSRIVTVKEANAINKRLKTLLAKHRREPGPAGRSAEIRLQETGASSMPEGRGEWVEMNAYVMPELPASLGVDPVVAALIHVASFLELSGDDAVDPDAATKAMEHLGFYLGRLPARKIAAIREQLDRIAAHAQAQGWDQEAVEFLAEFMTNFGLSDEDDRDTASFQEAIR